MIRYTHSLSLNEQEEKEFKKTGLGVKKIFMAMVKSLNKIVPPENIEETQGDGKNKSAIVLNFPTEQPSELTEKEMAIKQAEAVGVILEEE